MALKNKIIATFFLMMIFSLVVTAQEEVKHLVKSGETLSGLAKHYHTTVGEIMRLNNMTNRTILQIGKTIKIPSSKANVSSEAPVEKKTNIKSEEIKSTSSKDLDAKIHIVGPKETLYGISRKYGVTIAQIKTWNDLKSDVIHDNQKLIIIPQSKELAAKNITEQEIKTPEKQVAPVAQQVVSKQAEIKSTPVVTKSVEKQTKPVIVTKPSEKQAAPVIQQQSNSVVETKPIVVPQKDTAQKTIVTEKKETTNVAVKVPLPTISNNNVDEDDANFNVKNIGDEGYFASQYQKGKNDLTGDAAVFKTASGWLDKKYYILINSIDAGTIVRISANGKAVFAKVLGPLPDVKEDNGLLLRISNAAASVLGAPDSKFSVTVNY